MLKQSAVAQEQETPAVAIISYDEKPGVQAIGTTAPDLLPEPLRHGCVARDHEYVRHGTLSLLAGIDLVTGAVHASVEERHRSREFVGFLRKLDTAYPSTAIKLILDNHSAHISKETKAWLATQPEGRFTFVFTPKHGSWLNLVEAFFSKPRRLPRGTNGHSAETADGVARESEGRSRLSLLRAAQIYDAQEKAKGAKGNQYTGKVNRSDERTGPKTLADLGMIEVG